MTVKMRGEFIGPKDTVSLRATFKDGFGQAKDLDAFPQVSIRQPSGLLVAGPTSSGVSQISTGTYEYLFPIGFEGPFGVWNDTWIGHMDGFRIEASFNFVVHFTQTPALNTDGYIHLGDDPGFNYSQNAIANINKLMKTLRARLNSSGKSKSKDNYGNIIYVDCDIFSVDMLTTFLADSLSAFNEIPFFTFFSFEDTPIIDQFHNVLVEGATLMALASKALIERGREFQITDNGVNFTPPSIAEMLNTQYSTLLNNYFEKLKFIKNNMRPAPFGVGTLRPLNASPSLMRLRFLRERQIL